jgi:uncharacterized protein
LHDWLSVRKKKKSRKLKSLLGLVSLLIAGLVVYLAIQLPQSKIRDERHDREVVKRLHKDILSRHEGIPESGKKKSGFHAKRRVAIVIDDIGYDQAAVFELLKIEAPISFAILPYCPFSLWSAERIHQSGREILLHLPMEPHGYPGRNPGKGALLTSMDEKSINRELLRDLKAVPYARGVNNHMGSKFMEDERKLKIVFKRLSEKNLYFLDSMTTTLSKASQAAEQTQVKCMSRDVFIDGNGDQKMTCSELTQMIQGGETWTKKILIGHPYPRTISGLSCAVERISREGIEIVPLSRLE